MTEAIVVHPVERNAIDVFGDSWLTDEARSLLTPGQLAGDYLLLLTMQERYADAVQSLAYAMPNRQAIWWLCQCLWHIREVWKPSGRVAVKAAVDWVVHPSAETVANASQAADKAEFESPARCVANAVLWAGTSPEIEGQVSSRHQKMAAQLVGGGLSLAVVSAGNAGIDLTPRQVLALGFDVVNGVSRWDTILAWHAVAKTTAESQAQREGT